MFEFRLHQLFLRTYADHCAVLVDAVRRALDGPDVGAYERLRSHVLKVAEATASDVCLRGCLLAKGAAEAAPTRYARSAKRPW